MDHNKTSGSLHIPQLIVEGLTFPNCEILANILKDYNIDIAILRETHHEDDKKAAKRKIAD